MESEKKLLLDGQDLYRAAESTVIKSYWNKRKISPVFWGPTTKNFGNRSQVFSLDQISLCRLSSQGF